MLDEKAFNAKFDGLIAEIDKQYVQINKRRVPEEKTEMTRDQIAIGFIL